MANYVILDTCIYKELGFKFYNHPDLINIHAFTSAIDGEIFISPIVMAEFINHYETELKRKEGLYNKAIKDLERDAFFKIGKTKFVDISKKTISALTKFANKFLLYPGYNKRINVLASWDINSLELTRFILDSRNLGIKDVQVRDFLIWDSVLRFTKKHNLDRENEQKQNRLNKCKLDLVTFITKDEGFTTNPLFLELQQRKKITNVEIVKSIPEYLHLKGYNLPYVTKELIMAEFSPERILNDLSEHMDVLSIYITPLFASPNGKEPEIVAKDLNDIQLSEYYSYKDSETGDFKFVAYIKAHLHVLFEKWENEEIGNTLFMKYFGTYDYENGIPVFNNPVLIMYEGLLDDKTKTIKSIKFLNFLPWAYMVRK